MLMLTMKNVTDNTVYTAQELHTLYGLLTKLYLHSCKKNFWITFVVFWKNRSSNCYHTKNA